jgi:branched-chain amino acid transport system substrate-binding protein
LVYIDRTKFFVGAVVVSLLLNVVLGVALLDLSSGGDVRLVAGGAGQVVPSADASSGDAPNAEGAVADAAQPAPSAEEPGSVATTTIPRRSSGPVAAGSRASSGSGSGPRTAAPGAAASAGQSSAGAPAAAGQSAPGSGASAGPVGGGSSAAPGIDPALVRATPVPPALERQGVTDTTIKVGGITSTSGALSYQNVVDTVKAYFQFVNEQGGVNGRKLAYVSYDDGLDPARGMEAAKRLAEQDRVFALLGNFAIATTPQLVTSGYLQRNAMPLFGNHGVEEETFQTPWAWPIGIAAYRSGFTQAQWLITEKKLTKICGIYLDLKPARWSLKGLREGAQKFGSPLVKEVAASLAQPDYGSLLQTCVNAGAEAIVGITDAGGGIRMMQAHARLGLKVPVIGTEDYGGEAIKTQAGAAAKGLIAVDVWEVYGDTPSAREYRETMKRLAPRTQNTGLSTTAWVAAKFFVGCLKKVGQDVTRSAVIACYNSTKNWESGFGPTVSYSPENHDGNKVPYFIQLQEVNGKLGWVPISHRIAADIPRYTKAD